jgi:2-polyprenyl-6-methoxyphenol hydroxylase-like FAD-dependent oxidoreductase
MLKLNSDVTSEYDIAIVGAGFTGGFAGAALADGRRRIVVLDAHPAGRPQFGGELIHAAGIDMLIELRLWAILENTGGERVDGFRVSTDAGDPPVTLPYRDVPALRPGGRAIEHGRIVSGVRQYLADRSDIKIQTGQRVVDVLWRNGRVAGVRTASGQEITAALTLIADGRHSRTRKAVGIGVRKRAVSLSALATAPNESLPERRFACICLGAPGPTLAYSLRDRDVRFCIDVPIGDEVTRERVAARLRAEYAAKLPDPLRAQLLRALETSHLELWSNYIVQTDRCTVPGAALIGDAAGCSHPLTASGMTNSLSDIRILSEELRNSETLDEALARYEVRRYRFVRIREILAEELYEAFRAEGAGARAIRTGIFRYWRTSARGRAATVALLSGDDARLSTFVGEYLRVMRESIHGVVLGPTSDVSLRGRATSLAGLLKDSLELLNRVGAGVYTGTVR